MAWTVSIDVTDAAEKRYRATATRTDDVTNEVTTYSLAGQWDRTQVPKAQLVAQIRDMVWRRHEEAVAKAAVVASFVDTLETDLASALDALE